ncbi:related to tRNA-splicing endonuclease subunit SEN54 [Saccharomycodes ludwigii]|uniref:Related to tRNA-splicing endonuclease subunit SEN54 n=1 Tax=Saccharomycodes ludwigii TaxID=36035 RepID=A0A376B9D5_9ASCO|nr:hypothetical protein SCDLUD_002030 [Saccharomycodes ludwigii]KAH3902214.1 hypothetical protein SCDLUD_002030 [Saccharomycodes ludwigii]SSD61262.1 related to tRNA-splicing endonuclease subunit SEN54 [Saccharomycodes ludwigii]
MKNDNLSNRDDNEDVDTEETLASHLLYTSDDDDEVTRQDWTEMLKLSQVQQIIPKRGDKDYEPDGTNVQQTLLFNARNTMFDAISEAPRGLIIKHLNKAYYNIGSHTGIIYHAKGSFINNIGKTNSKGQIVLQFYEFVYLVERGTVIPYLKFDEDNEEAEIQLSVQDLYSFFRNQQELDEFMVYSHLKRLGYILHKPENRKTTFFPSNLLTTNNNLFCQNKAFQLWNIFKISLASPLNLLLLPYRSNAEIYINLQKLISHSKVVKTRAELLSTSHQQQIHTEKAPVSGSLNIAFDLWKPNPNFKKKCPDLPDFQILIHNKNLQNFPTFDDFHSIFNKLDYKFEFLDDIEWDEVSYVNEISRKQLLTPKQQKQQQFNIHNEQKKNKKRVSENVLQLRRLKNGFRKFILAVIDDGLINFITIAEADFSTENVWYEPQRNKVRSGSNKSKNRNSKQTKRDKTKKDV